MSRASWYIVYQSTFAGLGISRFFLSLRYPALLPLGAGESSYPYKQKRFSYPKRRQRICENLDSFALSFDCSPGPRIINYQWRSHPVFRSQKRRFSGVPAVCRAPTGTESRIATWRVLMSSAGAANVCVALWTVSRAAQERGLVRICIRPLDKSQRFPYLIRRQWLMVKSRFSRWVLMLRNQRCLGFYTEPYIHC